MALVAIFKRRGQGKEKVLDVTLVTRSSGTEREAFDLQILLSTLQVLVVVQVSYRAAHLEHWRVPCGARCLPAQYLCVRFVVLWNGNKYCGG